MERIFKLKNYIKLDKGEIDKDFFEAYLRNSDNMSSEEYEPEKWWSIIINLNPEEVTSLILELQLLVYARCNTLSLTSHQELSDIKLELNLNKNDDEKYSCVYAKDSINRVFLSLNELEYLLCFLLEYYRDGSTVVDHIDINLVDYLHIMGSDGTLTIKIK
ncbi:hypothetical protein [Paenibacillus sp. P36]|uniref:hypothetical protein n=1 Tax=Paenibacillus sp. P36 TaxID=3342538 RepID=UPI0038B39918